MWVLYLEAFVALFLLVFIVWWTMPSKKKSGAKPTAAKPALPKPRTEGGGNSEA